MQVAIESLKIGDRMRFSTELLERFESNPSHRSQLVEIVRIEEDVLDGTKIVMVSNVKDQICR